MIRTFFVILFVLLYLIIGIPVLGVFWLISKNEKWKNGVSSCRSVFDLQRIRG